MTKVCNIELHECVFKIAHLFFFLRTKPRLSQQGNRIKIFQGCDLHTKFLQILYHSITTKVVAINIQASEAVIQDVFFYHSSITSEACRFYHIIENQHIDFFYFWKSI